MAIVFFAVGLVVLVGGVGGTLANSMDMMPAAVAGNWAVIQGIGNAAGSGLALLGLALLFKKNKRLDRLVGGNTTSSRIRRTRMIKQAQDGGDEAAPRPSGRTTPAPSAAAAGTAAPRRTSPVPKGKDEAATREMRRATGRVSNRKRAPQ